MNRERVNRSGAGTGRCENTWNRSPVTKPPTLPVAIVSAYYRPVVGGAEPATESLARNLVRRGHRVTVVTKRTSRTHQMFEVLDGVEVHRIPPVGEWTSSGKWPALPWFFRALWQHLRNYEVICAVGYRTVGLAALDAGRLLRRGVVF